MPFRKPESNTRCRCPGPATRRDFLKVGVITGLGLTLGDYFSLREAAAQEATPAEAGAAAAPPGPPAESVIYIFLAGGLSHVDSFDPKPNAPLEYRGELGAVATNTGEEFGALLPKLAQKADRLAVIRSMSHTEAAHERGTHNMLTGYRPSPAITYPSMGSVVAHELGVRNDLPPYVCIPSASVPDLGTGYLNAEFGPFSVGGDPASDGFKVRDLNLPEGVDAARLDRRRSLLNAVDAHFRDMEQSDLLSAMDSNYQRAYALISSQAAREAFAIDQEPAEVRDEYGRHGPGQQLLLARRLVEGGARFVTVVNGGWDNHQNIKGALQGLLPPIDQALAALITDLERRGRLDKTLIVLASEFGRTVRINPDGGRDHWPRAFSVVLAGGGVKTGLIHGKTDAYGSEPVEHAVHPEDLAATVFTQLGIDPRKKLMSDGNRPVDIVRHGEVVQALLV